ncbi:MAG: aspartate--tRNA ligase [Rhodospirillaceae bacterium]|nr:aspartate--tRNA ligase [Rhodospirillaceae bacterium]
MHRYRSHTCNELTQDFVGKNVKLSGWVHRVRDHGHLVFIDLRDQYGITQCVVEASHEEFNSIKTLRQETVLSLIGNVEPRTKDTINMNIPTGQIELRIESLEIINESLTLPMPVHGDHDYSEEIRLNFRYLDLRRERMQKNIVLRSKIISSIRHRMLEKGFLELQTPILTASSPEGARDFLVPSRLHPGKFYALPQAPQQFKQLIMCSGFDRYFQIAPCFRDEDARADRSPGEFYQLDLEMAFVEQEDVFDVVEPVMRGVFQEFSSYTVSDPFPRITYADAMLRYGTDKPDLRNPIEISDVTELFNNKSVNFKSFKNVIEKGGVVRAIPAKGVAEKPRSFFDKLIEFTKGLGAPGLGYIIFSDNQAKGPIAKFIPDDILDKLRAEIGVENGDAIFLSCDQEKKAAYYAGNVRTELGKLLNLVENNTYKFCWIVDFPMFEFDMESGKVEFSHNPFSMPQGGLEALTERDPLDILAWQYDIVCNGVELSSGAIRNHRIDIMLKAFEIAGYSRADLENRFGALFNAFQYGAPPHGGIAPGIDRIVMLLADEPNIREVILFPVNQMAQDLMMGAPAEASSNHLKELNLQIKSIKS